MLFAVTNYGNMVKVVDELVPKRFAEILYTLHLVVIAKPAVFVSPAIRTTPN